VALDGSHELAHRAVGLRLHSYHLGHDLLIMLVCRAHHLVPQIWRRHEYRASGRARCFSVADTLTPHPRSRVCGSPPTFVKITRRTHTKLAEILYTHFERA